MNRITIYVLGLLWAAAALAAQSPVSLSWSRLAEDEPLRRLVEDERASIASEGDLVVSCPEEGCEWTLFVLDDPGIQSRAYALRGRVRYEGVDGRGMLELLNDFDSGQYFTRTVGESGPMGALTGDSEWRDIAMPFDTLGKDTPSRLTLRIVLPGTGRVSISDLELVQGDSMEELFGGTAVADPGLLGWGVLLGAGAVIGVLSGMGRARTLVLVLAWSVLGLGVSAIAYGIYARMAEYYGGASWISTGLMCVIMAALMVPMLRRRYAEIELRKIRAMDA